MKSLKRSDKVHLVTEVSLASVHVVAVSCFAAGLLLLLVTMRAVLESRVPLLIADRHVPCATAFVLRLGNLSVMGMLFGSLGALAVTALGILAIARRTRERHRLITNQVLFLASLWVVLLCVLIFSLIGFLIPFVSVLSRMGV